MTTIAVSSISNDFNCFASKPPPQELYPGGAAVPGNHNDELTHAPISTGVHSLARTCTNRERFGGTEPRIPTRIPQCRSKDSHSSTRLTTISRAVVTNYLGIRADARACERQTVNKLVGGSRRFRLTIGVVALLVLASLVVIGKVVRVDRGVVALRAWVEPRGAAGMVVFGLFYVVGALLFVPGAALTITAGAIFGLGWGTLVVSLASLTADVLAFLTARHLARAKVEQWAHQYPRFGAIDRAVREGGWKIVALLRLSPTVPYSASNYLYGLTGIRFVPYTLASWVFTLPGTFLYVYLGYVGTESLGGRSRTPGEWTLLLIGLLATVVAAIYVTRLARRALAARPDLR